MVVAMPVVFMFMSLTQSCFTCVTLLSTISLSIAHFGFFWAARASRYFGKRCFFLSSSSLGSCSSMPNLLFLSKFLVCFITMPLPYLGLNLATITRVLLSCFWPIRCTWSSCIFLRFSSPIFISSDRKAFRVLGASS